MGTCSFGEGVYQHPFRRGERASKRREHIVGPDGLPLPPGAPAGSAGAQDQDATTPGGKGLQEKQRVKGWKCVIRMGEIGEDGFWIGVLGKPGVRYVFQQWVYIQVWWGNSERDGWTEGEPTEERSEGWVADDGGQEGDNWIPSQGGHPDRGSALLGDKPVEEVHDADSAKELASKQASLPNDWTATRVKVKVHLLGIVIDATHNKIVASWYRTITFTADWEDPKNKKYSGKQVSTSIATTPGAGRSTQ